MGKLRPGEAEVLARVQLLERLRSPVLQADSTEHKVRDEASHNGTPAAEENINRKSNLTNKY